MYFIGCLRRRVLCRPLPTMRVAVATWSPGQAGLPFGELSYQLKRRWTAAPKMTTVIVSGENATRVFATRDTRRHEQQATHDLGVTEMYLAMRQCRSAEAASWSASYGNTAYATPPNRTAIVIVVPIVGACRAPFPSKVTVRSI